MEYMKNNSSLQNHVLHGNANQFITFLAFLGLWKTSQPDDAYEISTDDVSRKRIKTDEVSIGVRFSHYLLPCHPYGDNTPKKREFAFMEHAFTSLSLVEHDCFHKMTQDLNPWLQPVRRSKLPRSLIPTEKKSVERSVIERVAKVKAVVISYNLCMSCNIEENFLLTGH